MKLIRYGSHDREKPGVLLDDGRRIDVSGFGSDYDEAFFGGDGLKRLAAVFLKPGDVVELGIAGLGESRQVARAFTGVA